MPTIFIITSNIHGNQLKALASLLQRKGKMKNNVDVVEVIRFESELSLLNITTFNLCCNYFACSIRDQLVLSSFYNEQLVDKLIHIT